MEVSELTPFNRILWWQFKRANKDLPIKRLEGFVDVHSKSVRHRSSEEGTHTINYRSILRARVSVKFTSRATGARYTRANRPSTIAVDGTLWTCPGEVAGRGWERRPATYRVTPEDASEFMSATVEVVVRDDAPHSQINSGRASVPIA